MNIFDGVIVAFSLFDLFFLGEDGNDSMSAFAAFRSLKIFRIFKTVRVLRATRLLRALAFMQVIIGVVGRTIKSFIYIAMLLILFTFIYALIGMKLFGGKFDFPGINIRRNFDSFSDSFITVF